MKKYNTLLIIISLVLMMVNIFYFSSSIIISDRIATSEQNARHLTLSNNLLKQKIFSQNSLSRLHLQADSLGFTSKATPFYFHANNFAFYTTGQPE